MLSFILSFSLIASLNNGIIICNHLSLPTNLYKLLGKDKWLEMIIPLFKEAIKEKDSIKDNNNNIIN